jgi:hypothetical protein
MKNLITDKSHYLYGIDLKTLAEEGEDSTYLRHGPAERWVVNGELVCINPNIYGLNSIFIDGNYYAFSKDDFEEWDDLEWIEINP